MILFRFMATVRILNHLTVLECSVSTSRQQRETWTGSLEDLDGPTTKRSRGFTFINFLPEAQDLLLGGVGSLLGPRQSPVWPRSWISASSPAATDNLSETFNVTECVAGLAHNLKKDLSLYEAKAAGFRLKMAHDTVTNDQGEKVLNIPDPLEFWIGQVMYYYYAFCEKRYICI